MELVNDLTALEANLAHIDEYRKMLSPPASYLSLIELGTCFLPYRSDGQICFAPSRFIGYKNNDIDTHLSNKGDGRDTNLAISGIVGHSPKHDQFLEDQYRRFCATLNIQAREKGNFGVTRKFWKPAALLELAKEEKTALIVHDPEISTTEKEQSTLSRIGQGIFRSKLMEYWGGCALTRSPLMPVLRASHIKPWRVSSDLERLDPFNGLLLTPNADALFDGGYISFDEDGTLLVSASADKSAVYELIGGTHQKIAISDGHQQYMAYHRESVFIRVQS